MEKLLENAKKLPKAAKILAVSSYTQFLDKYAVVRNVELAEWDFIISVAGVFVALSQLNHESLDVNEKEVILDEVTNSATELSPNFVEACENCRKFVDTTYNVLEKSYKGEEKFLFSDSLGAWIVWNLFGHAPDSEDERSLTRQLGAFLVHSFFSWWK